MSYLYVLSDPDSIKAGKYKIGITCRSQEYLLRDYRRSRPEVKLFLFKECPNNLLIETQILDKFKTLRIPHESGTLSEWMKIDVNQLIKEIINLIKLESVEFLEEYNIKDFIKDKCILNKRYSTSCKILYENYLISKVNKRKIKKIIFCKKLLLELCNYYKCNSSDIKYKSKGLIYYKGISINDNWCQLI